MLLDLKIRISLVCFLTFTVLAPTNATSARSAAEHAGLARSAAAPDEPSGRIRLTRIHQTAPFPSGISVGADKTVWFTERGANKIGRMTGRGVITGYALPTPNSRPTDITTGSDGAEWFTEAIGKIGRITAEGHISEFPLAFGANRITLGPDQAIWFTGSAGAQGYIGRITADGSVTSFAEGEEPEAITTGPDNALWFTDYDWNIVGRITTAGVLTNSYRIPDLFASPLGITSADGALWFTENTYGTIVELMLSGEMTEYTPKQNCGAEDITAASDGSLWFTGCGAIGRLRTSNLGSRAAAAVFSQYRVRKGSVNPFAITTGANGNIWFTALGGVGAPRGYIGEVSL